jgi:hypothetical protein
MNEAHPASPHARSWPQGDARLLGSPTARRLLSSTIPARMAYTSVDGTPRVVPSWFHWNGEEIVMATFRAAPHVRHPASRIRALQERPTVAVMIDTEDFPPEVLDIRGDAELTEVAGVDEEYAKAAHRYLGVEAAEEYLGQLDDPVTKMVRIAVRPSWVGLIDFESRLPSALGGVTA